MSWTRSKKKLMHRYLGVAFIFGVITAFQPIALADHGIACNPSDMFRPANGAPVPDAMDVSITPMLVTGAFPIPNFPCTWNATQWIIASDPQLNNVVYASPVDFNNLFNHTVPSGMLQPNTKYWWYFMIRHEYNGQNGGPTDSFESFATSFTTEKAIGNNIHQLPSIKFLVPNSASPGSLVSITGTYFFPFLSPSVVLFDSQSIPTNVKSNTEIEFHIPQDATCGSHKIQVENTTIGNINGIRDLSNEVTLTVTHPCQQAGGLIPPASPPQITKLLPDNAAPDTSIRIEGTGFEPRFVPTTEVLFDGQPIPAVVVSSLEIEIVIPKDAHCGPHAIQAQNGVIGGPPNLSNEVSVVVIQPCQQPGGLLPPVQPPPPNPGPPPGGGQQPPLPQPNSLQQYDSNQNCKLDDAEFFMLIDAWIQQVIGNAFFFLGVDSWIQQSTVCIVAASSSELLTNPLSINRTLMGLRVSTQDPNVSSLMLAVFDASGSLVAHKRSLGRRLSWRQAMREWVLANGVYVYHVVAMAQDGRVLSGQIGKVVLLR